MEQVDREAEASGCWRMGESLYDQANVEDNVVSPLARVEGVAGLWASLSNWAAAPALLPSPACSYCLMRGDCTEGSVYSSEKQSFRALRTRALTVTVRLMETC